MGRTRPAPPPPDTARAHIERPPRPRAAGSRSAQCGGGARVPGAPRAAPRAAGAGRRGQSGPVSPPPAQVAVIAGGWRCARVRLHCRRRRGRKVRGAARGSGLGGRRRRTALAVLGYGSRNLDSPPEVSRSLHPNLCWTPAPSPPEVSAQRPRPLCALHSCCRPDVPGSLVGAVAARLCLRTQWPGYRVFCLSGSAPIPPPGHTSEVAARTASRLESVYRSPTLSLGTSVSPGFPSLSLSLLLSPSP